MNRHVTVWSLCAVMSSAVCLGLAVNYTASAQRTLNGPLCARIGP